MRLGSCPEPDELAALAEGTTDDALRGELAEHLSACAPCRRVCAELVRGRAPMTALTPPSIGRYMLGEPLGAGAMGVVFRGHDPLLDRAVAIKVIDGHALEAAARDRLLLEAQALARVSAPGVVACYDAGFADGDVFIAMELIEGETLRAWSARAPELPGWKPVVDLLLEVARGLAAAHAAGLIHRDVKPENVLVRRAGTAALGDFGLARATVGSPAVGHGGLGVGTRPAGTPRYLAPEVQAGAPATALSDQFAFCLTVLETLTGEITRDALAAVRGPLHAILARGASPLPSDRFPSMAALAAELARVTLPRRVNRSLAIALALAGVAVVAGGSWLMVHDASAPACSPPPLEAKLYGPVTRAQLAGIVGSERWPVLDRLLRGQLAEHRSRWLAACSAEHASAPPPMVRACLADASDDLTRFLDRVVSEPALASYLVDRSYDLLQIEACRPGVTRTLMRPPPAALEPLVRAVRGVMLHVDAALQAEQLATATALGANLAWTANLGDRSLTADVTSLRSSVASWAGDEPAAARLLSRARELARESGDPVRRVRLLLGLARSSAGQRNDIATATALADEAAPIVASLGNQIAEADLAYVRALIALMGNQLPAASAASARAVELELAIFGPERPELGAALILRGQIETLAAEPDAARLDYERAIAIYTHSYGAMHGETLNARMSLATNELTAGHAERGKAEYRAVLEALAQRGEPSVIADARDGLCEALSELKDPETLPACRQALAAAEAAYGAANPRIGPALLDLAEAESASGDDRLIPETIRLLRRAETATTSWGADEHAVASILLARSLAAHHEAPAEVRTLLERAIPVLRKSPVRAPLVELVPVWYPAWRSLDAFYGAGRPPSR